MPSKIFVNLPVNDLQRSIHFFTTLGFTINPAFTSEKAACLVIKEGAIYAMLITKELFSHFTKKEIADASKTTEVLLALEVQSRMEVDNLVSQAVAAGGMIYREPEDQGWMYGHSFADPDGHQWEVLYIDESNIPTS